MECQAFDARELLWVRLARVGIPLSWRYDGAAGVRNGLGGAYETAKGAELDKKDSFVAVLVADVCSVRHAQGARRSAR